MRNDAGLAGRDRGPAGLGTDEELQPQASPAKLVEEGDRRNGFGEAPSTSLDVSDHGQMTDGGSRHGAGRDRRSLRASQHHIGG